MCRQNHSPSKDTMEQNQTQRYTITNLITEKQTTDEHHSLTQSTSATNSAKEKENLHLHIKH